MLEYTTTWLKIAEDTDSLVTSYTDATPSNGAQYQYEVRALRGEGDDPERSEASNIAEVTIPNPPRPHSLTASSTATGIQLSWSAGHLSWEAATLDLTGYEIVRFETPHAGNLSPQWEVLVDSTNDTGTSYLDASGYSAFTYSYAIRAVHGFIRSHWEGIAGPVAGHLTATE